MHLSQSRQQPRELMKGGKMGRLSKAKWCALGCLIVVLLFVAGSVFLPGALTGAVSWLASGSLTERSSETSAGEVVQKETLVEMVVENVGVSKIDYQPVVILKEQEGELYIPIGIGLLEANSISVVLEGIEVSRPLTTDLLCSIINRMGVSVDYIVINDLRNNIFYANIYLNANWTQMEIDARPSDAIGVALRVGAPIYVEKAVLDKAGVHPDHETGKYTIRQWEIVA